MARAAKAKAHSPPVAAACAVLAAGLRAVRAFLVVRPDAALAAAVHCYCRDCAAAAIRAWKVRPRGPPGCRAGGLKFRAAADQANPRVAARCARQVAIHHWLPAVAA